MYLNRSTLYPDGKGIKEIAKTGGYGNNLSHCWQILKRRNGPKGQGYKLRFRNVHQMGPKPFKLENA